MIDLREEVGSGGRKRHTKNINNPKIKPTNRRKRKNKKPENTPGTRIKN